MNKNLKPVPADKKKSLGKLPTDVRNKMGYAKKGSMMKANKGGETVKKFPKDMLFRPTPEQAEKMSNDPTRKARLKKLLENRIKDTKPDSSNTKQKLKDALKGLGKVVSPAATTAKKTMDIIITVPKKAKGGVLYKDEKGMTPMENKKLPKKPMKAVLGAAVLGAIGAKAIGKAMKKKASISPAMNYLGQTAKKSKGGEMKKGYGAARTSGMGLQDENLIPGKSMDYYKDLM